MIPFKCTFHTPSSTRGCVSPPWLEISWIGYNDSSLWCKGRETVVQALTSLLFCAIFVLESVLLHVKQIVSSELSQSNKTYHIPSIPDAFCLCFTWLVLHLPYHVPWFEVFLCVCHNAVYKSEITVCLGSFFCWTPKSMLTVNQNGLVASSVNQWGSLGLWTGDTHYPPMCSRNSRKKYVHNQLSESHERCFRKLHDPVCRRHSEWHPAALRTWLPQLPVTRYL